MNKQKSEIFKITGLENTIITDAAYISGIIIISGILICLFLYNILYQPKYWIGNLILINLFLILIISVIISVRSNDKQRE